jgi:hypothetical protein
MFERLSGVRWSRADDAPPPSLADLRKLADPRATSAAVGRALAGIETSIYDQGCAGANTTKAVPFLVEILDGSPTARARAKILELLADMLTDDEELVFEPLRGGGALATAIRAGLASYERLAGDADPSVRMHAARLLAYAATGARRGAVAATLARRAATEKHEGALGAQLLAVAILGGKPAPVRSPARSVEVCAALAALRADPRSITRVEDTLLAAIDRPLASDVPFFAGDLRAAAVRALGRFGRGRQPIVDALIARRLSDASVEDGATLGALCVEALVEIATPSRGKLDASGKAIVLAILDAKPGGALAARGLPGDPVTLRRKLGVESTPVRSVLERKIGRTTVADLLLGEIESARIYAPAAVVAKIAPADRAEVAIDLVTGRGGIADHWRYGKIRGRFRPGEELRVADRRSARAYDLALRLLSDPAATAPLDRAIADLAAGMEAATGNLDRAEIARRYREPLGILSLARGVLYARAKAKIPSELHARIASVALRPDLAPIVRPLVPAIAKALDGYAWVFYGDLLPTKALLAKAKLDEVVLVRDGLERILKALPAKDGDVFVRALLATEAAKSARNDTELVWKGQRIPCATIGYPWIPKLDQSV